MWQELEFSGLVRSKALVCENRDYSRFRLIGPPVNWVSRLIGPNCEERNSIKENTLYPHNRATIPLNRATTVARHTPV